MANELEEALAEVQDAVLRAVDWEDYKEPLEVALKRAIVAVDYLRNQLSEELGEVIMGI